MRTGGRGSVRRKKRVTKVAANNEDKKVQSTLKRLGVQPIPGIEEVNLFMEDGSTVVNFKNPKVQAAVAANTFVVSGPNEKKNVSDMMPGIFSQMDQSKLFSSLAQNLKMDKEKMEQLGAEGAEKEQIEELVGEKDGDAGTGGDEDIPDLVENFEDVSEEP